MGLSGQLYEAVGSIHANFSEGYSRSSAKDQVRFYEYSLGSAREARGWYYDAQHLLGITVSNHRINLITQIIRILLKIIPNERGTVLKESTLEYVVEPAYFKEQIPY